MMQFRDFKEVEHISLSIFELKEKKQMYLFSV